MMKTIEALLGYTRLTVPETHRALILRKGRFDTILGPGEHMLARNGMELELHDITNPRFTSKFADALMKARPDLAEAHLTEGRTGAGEVAVVEKDGTPFEVLAPETRALFWTDAGPWAVERFDVTGDLAVDPKLHRRLVSAGLRGAAVFSVPDSSVGLLTVDGELAETLKPGTHAFWSVPGRTVSMKQVDMRWQSHDVSGQEILTKDRVTLRVNLAADFRVTDPVKAVSEVKDFVEALHRALQLAFRKTLGALTLDQLLADKVSVDAEAAAAVRTEMATIGVEVGEIALKDVILPGEMRDILNQVVAAQKEAEANVIRRREETNATRSLLNTAKVMEENPVMLRLKELEALEAIAGKVERLTVHNGTAGLMSDLVKLAD